MIEFAVATRAFVPDAVPSVQVVTAAKPLASLDAVVPVAAPDPIVTEKVTVAFGTGLLWASVTKTCGAVATAVPTCAV